jgi:hypothetical protein
MSVPGHAASGPPRAERVLAIIPAYNEAGNIGSVVRELRALDS